MQRDPQNLSRVVHRQAGLVPTAPRASLRVQAWQLLQGALGAAAVVLLFGAAGWLDQHSEDQHRLAGLRHQVAVERAFDEGVQHGRAQTLRTAELAWQAALAEQQHQCGGVRHAQ
jgi:hypothetical protein